MTAKKISITVLIATNLTILVYLPILLFYGVLNTIVLILILNAGVAMFYFWSKACEYYYDL
jgi:multidrug efflux pump subunit AcrB